MKDLISSLLLKLRQQHPFLATIMLFTDYQFSEKEKYFSTDGKNIYINQQFFSTLSTEQQRGLLLHTCLHCALLHAIRRNNRDIIKWNIAADIVVNNIIEEVNYAEIPVGTAYNLAFEDLSVEQIYERLQCCDAKTVTQHYQIMGSQSLVDDLPMQPIGPEQAHQNKVYWRQAVRQAQDTARAKQQGWGYGGMFREIAEIEEPQLDWRTRLWRFMTKTPCDFSDFDRRFIHQGLYVEQLMSDSLPIVMAIDTSGSIDKHELTIFMSETQAILHAYPHIQVTLYFVDTQIHGPHILNEHTKLPEAFGDGGTDFTVFFDELEKQDNFSASLCIYLTDGYSDFPDKPPNLPVLWVVTSGGEDTDRFPFGEVARLAY